MPYFLIQHFVNFILETGSCHQCEQKISSESLFLEKIHAKQISLRFTCSKCHSHTFFASHIESISKNSKETSQKILSETDIQTIASQLSQPISVAHFVQDEENNQK